MFKNCFDFDQKIYTIGYFVRPTGVFVSFVTTAPIHSGTNGLRILTIIFNSIRN